MTEFRRVSRYAKIADRLSPPRAGQLVRRLRDVAIMIDRLPIVDICNDPADNFLLALAEIGSADYLVTGDKADLLSMGNHRKTRIISVRSFAEILGI